MSGKRREPLNRNILLTELGEVLSKTPNYLNAVFKKVNGITIKQYINKEKKTTILLTSHDLKDMEWLCRRLIILEKGEILFDDEITKIFDNYPEAETLEEIIIELFNGNTKK